MPTRLRSHSKINLGLAIGPVRGDGFHSLLTVYQTLALHEFVKVTATPSRVTRIAIRSNDARVPTDGRNTCWKIIVAALERCKLQADVEIEIDKRLPVQGGLGAGSANAAAALVGLQRELGFSIPPGQEFELAEQVGSDVPLFLVGGTVLGIDRGQEVYPLPDLAAMPCLIAMPEVGIATPQAFQDWDALQGRESGHGGAALTANGGSGRLKQLSRAVASCFSGVSSSVGDLAGNPLLALVRTGIENDFEQVVFSQHPSLRAIKRALEGSQQSYNESVFPGQDGAIFAALSGSGSALFGLYASQEAAQRAQARVETQGGRALLTRTMPRRQYWDGMAVPG